MQHLKQIRLIFVIALLSCVCLLGIGTIALATSEKIEPRASETVTAAYAVGANSTAEYVQADGYCGAGLQAWFSKGDTLTLNTVIDLNEWNASESLFEGYATPTKTGTADYRRLYFTLTDVEDPDVSVSIQYRGWEGQNYSVVSACATGQRYTSVEWYTGKVFIGENAWQTISMHTFTGLMHENGGTHYDAPVEAPIRVWYDQTEKMLYYDVVQPGTSKKMIVDLDDPAYFDTLFTGFPSGRVRLSVQASEYLSDSAGFRLTKVAGIDLSDDKISDDVEPAITVDTPWTENVPTAKVGGSFPVPAATAYDMQFGVCEVAAKVEYAETESGARADVAVADGRFATQNAGFYFITYTAQDPLDNTAQEVITVQTGDVPVPTVTVDTETDAATTGNLVSVRAATVLPTSETTTLTVKATFGNEEIVAQNGKFRPMQSGDWTVTYTAADICGQTDTKSYILKVTASDTPIFLTEPTLPKTFISGGRYFLPQVNATSFANGTEQSVPAIVKVKDAVGERTVAADEVYIPRVINNRDTVKITYEAGGGKWEKDIECILPFVAEGNRMRLKIENYFTFNDIEFEKTDYNATVSATAANGNFTFDRELLLENFSVEFATQPNRSAFRSIYLKLKDAADEGKTVTCKLERDNEGNATFVSGSTRIGVTPMFVPYTSPTSVMLSFGNNAWSFGGNWSLKVLRWDDGEAFNGFTSDYVYCEMGFENAENGAAFTLSAIGGQPISANPYDNTAPYISMAGDFGGSVHIGSTVTVHEAFAVDVLDPMAHVSVSVRMPNGETATSVDGVRLDHAVCSREYQFKVEEYGDYLISYTASDAFGGNTQNFNYVVGVFDEDAPTIAVKGSPATEGKVGETFVLPSVEVSDNITATENIRVSKCVFTPKGAMVYINANSNAFVPAYAGEYTVVIMAYDEAGNVQTYTHKVTVK